ncbi:hypothetical protein GGS20DRAFT_22347 [Poronia punctata]|nr:hypothetical protein GGS20DRAFT_22347 [Poronia punctata]
MYSNPRKLHCWRLPRRGRQRILLLARRDVYLSDPLDECALLDSSLTPAVVPGAGTSCDQGSLPSYYLHKGPGEL